MLKKLIPNSDLVIEKCIGQTLEYLKSHPKDFTKKDKNKKIKPVSRALVTNDIEQFFQKNKGLSKQTTVADELVSDMLELIGSVEPEKRIQVQEQYNRQKQIEMMIGDFLEMYLLKHSFAYGWVQTGNCITGTDMIKKNADGKWWKLQIKNSDNTPNSSSAGFIEDKAQTWKRRNSKKGTQYWHEFPDPKVRAHLSENSFRDFIKSYFV